MRYTDYWLGYRMAKASKKDKQAFWVVIAVLFGFGALMVVLLAVSAAIAIFSLK